MAKKEKSKSSKANPLTAPIQAGGLNNDNSLVNQPQGTTRFVLNAVNETREGDSGFIAVEEGNAPNYFLPNNFVPIGKVYIGDENELLFLASPSGNSALAILDKNQNVSIIVSDVVQQEKFGFKITQQIDATFRLRRGCERVVYWVDPKPRMFIIEKAENFKVDISQLNAGDWDISKFDLFKKYKKIPRVEDIEVIDGGGNLPAGSYNFSIQYLDEDFNPTEFVTSTETIEIYNSALTSAYKDIRGATKKVNEYLQYENSNKAIKIVINADTLDTSFPFYRLAITEANTGSGQISDTKVTAEISTKNSVFFYTGDNYESSITQEEVTIFNNIIEEANSIEQIENRLILGKVKGNQINFCKLQKYASRISSDLVTRETILTELSNSNCKDPSMHFNGIGYMPGEIYSFGIVFIFEDRSVSPVFHIPGKNLFVPTSKMYSAGEKTYPMSNIDNSCQDTQYIENNTCGEDSFWGVDCEGQELKDSPVRHHRFPLRTDYNIPFVKKVEGNLTSNYAKKLLIEVESETTTVVATECPEPPDGCVPSPAAFDPFVLQVNYAKNISGVPEENTSDIIDLERFTVDDGDNVNQKVTFVFNSSIIITNVLEVLNITENLALPNVISFTTPTGTNSNGQEYYEEVSAETGLKYRVTVLQGQEEFKQDLYTAEIFGIRFSNIVAPSMDDTNGKKVIGYYIVRNERKESDKTVIDSAVLLPTLINKNFVSQGLLFPKFSTVEKQNKAIKKDIVGFISPEHKFRDSKYSTFSTIIQQGDFKFIDSTLSRTKINDVVDGSGYVSGKHKKGERDNDGFTLQIKTRDSHTKYIDKSSFTLESSDIKETFYLDALDNKLIKDKEDKSADVFNLACDNKIGIISLNKDLPTTIAQALPYVYLIRDNSNPYSNYRLDPYYKENKNYENLVSGKEVEGQVGASCEVFNGDSYISSIKYVNSIFYDNRMKLRKGKTSVWNYIVAGLLVAVAVVATIFSFGGLSATIPGALAVGAALTASGVALGAATALTLSGIKQDAWNKAYTNLYKEGLRETITDEYLLHDLDPQTLEYRGFEKNPEDDEIQWLGEAVNLWFESNVNMGLRYGATDGTPDFVNSPSVIETGTQVPEYDYEYFGIHSVGTERIPPTTSLDNHMVNKLTYLDSKRKESKAYYGLALAEMYLINPDYDRRNHQKAYNHLPLEYDCCSDCVEDFPHRWHWSEQAFQEELTDNFRAFLPNNYKDLEAETGAITDIFRIKNNLYIHTEEALWHCPQSVQERVTSDIISFIGTGDYFSIPPRKVVDDNNSSAGNRHKWARTKTKYGVLFPCAKEKKWYLFDEQSLTPISDQGLSNYFKTEMDFDLEMQYYGSNGLEYPYSNNPSNKIGVGFLSTYDSNKERFIVTKKDIKMLNLPEEGFELCSNGSNITYFPDKTSVIEAREKDGWKYLGIENCMMKFRRDSTETQIVEVNELSLIENDTKVFVFYDGTGSFTNTDRANLKAAMIEWYQGIRPDDVLDVNGESNSFKHNILANEKWLTCPNIIQGAYAHSGKTLCITLVNETYPFYHGTGPITNVVNPVTSDYITDYNNFIALNFESFIGINYPIVTKDVVGASYMNQAKVFLQHSLAAVKGRNYTLAEVNDLEVNSIFTTPEWTTLKSSLLSNPYSVLTDGAGDPGLEKYGWVVKSNKNNKGTDFTQECPAVGDVISPCQLALDLNEILSNSIAPTIVEQEVEVPVVEIAYEEGYTFDPEYVETGWTMSYSLKTRQWVSWHSYIPNFYFHAQERFYSWKIGEQYLYKHNIQGLYRTFYDNSYPFIIEFVDNPVPLLSKITDSVLFQSEAKRYDEDTKDYYDVEDITFNKVLFYNTRQISGWLALVTKDQVSNYLNNQIKNTLGVALIDRNERDWTINSFRDFSSSSNVPLFIRDKVYIGQVYFIDKVINPEAINENKDWTELESFRDKFLVVRLVFDTFVDTRLIFNFSALDKKISER